MSVLVEFQLHPSSSASVRIYCSIAELTKVGEYSAVLYRAAAVVVDTACEGVRYSGQGLLSPVVICPPAPCPSYTVSTQCRVGMQSERGKQYSIVRTPSLPERTVSSDWAEVGDFVNTLSWNPVKTLRLKADPLDFLDFTTTTIWPCLLKLNNVRYTYRLVM